MMCSIYENTKIICLKSVLLFAIQVIRSIDFIQDRYRDKKFEFTLHFLYMHDVVGSTSCKVRVGLI